MKILTAHQIKEADKVTIKNEPIVSIDLMERAAFQCFSWLEDYAILDEKNIHIFCGMGNNGGDGLAIARLLYEDDYLTGTYMVHFSEHMSDDFVTNFKRAESISLFPGSIHSKDDFPDISKDDIVIDAIFGIGLHKPPKGFTKELIQHINSSGAKVYSIDIPSGLYPDKPVEDKDAVIKADEVLSFHAPKLAFLLPDNKDFIASFNILDIGLDKEFITKLSSDNHFTIQSELVDFFKKRNKFSHKGNFGHSLLIGGSYGKIGAVVLASKAALRSGSGLITVYIPKCGYNVLQTAVPEVMVEVDNDNELEYFNFKVQPNVIGIGFGMGTSQKTANALGEFLERNTLPLVIDADALNIIAKNKDFLNLLPDKTILTPHPKELERLIGVWKDDFQKMELIKAFSIKYNCVVVLKGAHTMIVQNEQFYFNSSGNPALATAGTGDVLTGIITGLLAQSYSPLEAARLGVYIHGYSADIVDAMESFIASDIIENLPDAFRIFRDIKDNKYEHFYSDKERDDFFENLRFDDDFDDDFDMPY